MHKCSLTLTLRDPWVEQRFITSQVGYINYLVGPNGSGKSRFADELRHALPPRHRLLSTDRLRGLERHGGLGIWGDLFDQGIDKEHFSRLQTSGVDFGFGMDTFVLLERRLDLRIRVEATLSHVFNRRIILEWDSGKLIPKAALGSAGKPYKIAGDECHGIRELLVLLTHLYNDEIDYLIIDEPEQNLHPQMQSFLMEEVRKVAGEPSVGKGMKVIFLITHSPFMLDLHSVSDLKSIVSFNLSYSAPRHLYEVDSTFSDRLQSLVPRLNVHHKQLFFADSPVFVEGVHDAQIVAAIQQARRVSNVSAGSCIIDAGGKDEVAKYLELCLLLGKTAHSVFDLDSLFRGSLRQCIRGDGAIEGFLARMGLGADFGEYVGALERKLTKLYASLKAAQPSPSTKALLDFAAGVEAKGPLNWEGWARIRVALLIHLKLDKSSLIDISSEQAVNDIEGRLLQIAMALRERHIYLLLTGELENSLPAYVGSPYDIPDSHKNQVVQEELRFLAAGPTTDEMRDRYRELYQLIEELPNRSEVDFDKILKIYVSKYVFDLQSIALSNPTFEQSPMSDALNLAHPAAVQLFQLTSFERKSPSEFSAEITIVDRYRQNRRVLVSHKTNAAMQDFTLEKILDG